MSTVTTRDCRFCGESSPWDSKTCVHCGREKWNDPDGTRLGQTLGELERQDPAVARAAAKYDKIMKKLLK